MASGHVGHDCVLGEEVIVAHGAMLGGHCEVGDRVFIGGGAAIHQFVRIGRLVIIKGNEGITSDVPPFAAVRYDGLKGYNAIGCKRSGMPAKTLRAIRSAYHCIHTHRTLPGAIAAIRATVPMLPEIEEMLEFLRTTKRGVLGSVRARRRHGLGWGRPRRTIRIANNAIAPCVAPDLFPGEHALKHGSNSADSILEHGVNFARRDLGPAIEADQLDQYGDADQFAAETIHQIATRLHGSAGGEHIVDDQDALAADNRVGVHFQSVLAVFQVITH